MVSSSLLSRLRDTAILLALRSALVFQAGLASATTSGTFDERPYLDYAFEAYKHGSFKKFADFGAAPLPVLLGYAPAVLSTPASQAAEDQREDLLKIARRTNTLLV